MLKAVFDSCTERPVVSLKNLNETTMTAGRIVPSRQLAGTGIPSEMGGLKSILLPANQHPYYYIVR